MDPHTVSMRWSRGRRALVAVTTATTLLFAGASAADAQSWRLEQPEPPRGAPFKVPLGAPGDLQCIARNRCLLTIEGNRTVARGIYYYDGVEWRQLATVCGGPGDTARIAFAGPSDFWIVSEPSLPRRGAGNALCHFVGGEVVASYSTPPQSPDPYAQMFAATCNGPSDCWFGGVATRDPTGQRVGAFHLHWDGTTLETVYGSQGRAISDLETHNGTIFESTLVGARRFLRGGPIAGGGAPVEGCPPPSPADETCPRLIHRITPDRQFVNDAFLPLPRMQPDGMTPVPEDGTELLGLDSDGSQLWAVGGGAASGPSALAVEGGTSTNAPRVPLVARLEGDTFRELELRPSEPFTVDERLVDVAAIPGTTSAYAALQTVATRESVNAKARVALIGADGTVQITRLPVSGSGRGSAAKISFTAANEGWMVTSAGWLFHFTDRPVGSAPPEGRDADPAFAGTITFRPNEAAEQAINDDPPEDDSLVNQAPPPVTKPVPACELEAPPSALRGAKSKLRKGLVLEISFRVTRPARIGLVARKGRRVVGRTPVKLFRPGRRSLRLKLSRKRYPNRLAFVVKERKPPKAKCKTAP